MKIMAKSKDTFDQDLALDPKRQRDAMDLLVELENAGVPKSVIARKLAVSPSAVTSLYAGTRHLKYDEAMQVIKLLPNRVGGHEIPVIGMAGAGSWLEAIEETRAKMWVPNHSYANAKFAVEVVGDSMNRMMPESSIAIVDPADTSLFSGKVYLLRNGEGEATIKRYRTEPSRFEPVSDNPEHKAFEMGSSDFKVIGRVIGAMQSF